MQTILLRISFRNNKQLDSRREITLGQSRELKKCAIVHVVDEFVQNITL